MDYSDEAYEFFEEDCLNFFIFPKLREYIELLIYNLEDELDSGIKQNVLKQLDLLEVFHDLDGTDERFLTAEQKNRKDLICSSINIKALYDDVTTIEVLYANIYDEETEMYYY